MSSPSEPPPKAPQPSQTASQNPPTNAAAAPPPTAATTTNGGASNGPSSSTTAAQSSSVLSRRFPRLAATATRIGGSRAGRAGQGFWKYRRSIFFGFFAVYTGVGYLKLKRDAYLRDYIHPETYLVWKIHDGSIVESRGPPTLGALLNAPAAGEEAPRVLELFEAIRALKWAQGDERIKGIFADFSGLHLPSSVTPNRLGLAQIEELVQSIHEFKMAKRDQFGEKARPSIAWADTFDSQGAYLLASAFDEVWLQPTGTVPLTGLGAQIPFFKKLLAYFGVKVHAEARREYKSMISTFNQDEELPPAQAQNEAEMLGELNRGLMHAIGVNRFPEADPSEMADQLELWAKEGPFSSREAAKLGLINGIAFKRDLVKRLVDPKHGGIEETKFKSLHHYNKVNNRHLDRHLKDDEIIEVGVVYLLGTISNAPGEYSASSVIKGLKEAAEDDDIKSIVLRIDSGGGDVVASESIWDAVRRVREDYGKPVVASFGNASASGGYYAASAADAILACENTVTGSIGVASLRPTITRAFFDRFHVGIQSFFTGSTSSSTLHDMDDQQRAKQSRHIDEMYDDFLTKVCDGRGISRDVIESLAGGRVMTGLTAWTRCNPEAELEQVDVRDISAKDVLQAGSEASGAVADGTKSSAVLAGPSKKATKADVKKVKAVSLTSEWRTRDATVPGGNNTVLIERVGASGDDAEDGFVRKAVATASEVIARAEAAAAAAVSSPDEEGKDAKDVSAPAPAPAAATTADGDEAVPVSTTTATVPPASEGSAIEEVAEKTAETAESIKQKMKQRLEEAEAKLAVAAHAAAEESRSALGKSGGPPSDNVDPSASKAGGTPEKKAPGGDDGDDDVADEIRTAGVASTASDGTEAKGSPYGRGLVDSIGGIWDSAYYAMTLGLQREIDELVTKENLTLEQATERVRPGANRSVSEDGTLAVAADLRLVRFPEDKPFWKKVQDMNRKGDEPQLSILPRSVASTLSVLADDVAHKAAKAALRMIIASSMDPSGIAHAFEDGKLAEQIRNHNGSGWGSKQGRARAEYPFAAYFT
ncbi:uncharacterized protein PFL1_02523 [Pseudozyma flocculosa PF-1]|uniref:Related to Signal peptide peptidase n=2 Tax=Pseudozyma flocculosa TaxID=84751 RepID=A0A5C3EZU9_9BASI|nr:uncharacterized protein PFL1_02523 [Pseudozyma flocculosa PF-1]EPQ29850.1 hypothetical protein PFL1_02523 [Pseudozyma flocculosa PF-1]SPO37146.1 related to Signal peptide peptidase [Pseudozyma flocculosa]